MASLCMVGGQSQLAASCGSNGSIHVWSTQSGTLAAHFAEPASPGPKQRQGDLSHMTGVPCNAAVLVSQQFTRDSVRCLE